MSIWVVKGTLPGTTLPVYYRRGRAVFKKSNATFVHAPSGAARAVERATKALPQYTWVAELWNRGRT